jgi:hypothetical protein
MKTDTSPLKPHTPIREGEQSHQTAISTSYTEYEAQALRWSSKKIAIAYFGESSIQTGVHT